jgi:hypothetical protein
MNYLLFVYYNSEVENSEQKTQEIGTLIAENKTSGQVKFMYGDRHAIFHFGCKIGFQDVADVVFFISQEIPGFEYLLTKKGRDYSSNFDEDNLDHLMSLRDVKPKKHIPSAPKINYDFKPNDGGKDFMDIADILFNLKRKEICNLTLDELLDKISEQGMDSLTEVEKQKLEEYSKSI